MRFSFILLITIISCALLVNSFNPLIRRTRYGFVRGTFETSKTNFSVKYLSFMGIPYARPPVENLRFREPQKLRKWDGIRETKTQSQRCVQFSDNFDGPDVIGSEDCLYLNVFIPKVETSQLLPVLFWIHGGTFVFGSNANAGPDYVMEKPIVLVTVQYRVNVFGFLSTGDEYGSGNWGLKDQLMALKWVKENIKSFKGDPARVTIVGESAGGASVQYHILSPKSKGYFQRAISHSGSTMNRWAHQEHPRTMVLRLAKGLGIRNTDSKGLIEELRKVDYKTLEAAAFNASIIGFYTPYYAQPFCPTIEKEGDLAFISKSTYDLLKLGNISSNVPYILGYNTEEGSFAYNYIKNGRADINRYQKNPRFLLPLALNIHEDSLCAQEVVERIKSFYFKNGPTNDKKNWINYMSYELFVRSIRKSVEFMHEHMPLYFYKFSFKGSRNESYVGGVGHHEELMYLWRSRRNGAQTNETEADTLTRKRFVTMWANFATTGNPTPKRDPLLQNINWPTVTQSDRVPFLDIGSDLTLGFNPDHKDYKFWEEQFHLCGNPPYTSY